jgi:hypothetical protein
MRAKDVRKALVAAATFVAQLVALGAVPESALPYVIATLGALTVYGVYAVRNGDAPSQDGTVDPPTGAPGGAQ